MIEIFTATIFVFFGVLYSIHKFYTFLKNVKIGTLLFAFIRDINKLLHVKLMKEWSDLPLTAKLDRLRAIYDLIEQFDSLEVPKNQKDLLEDIDNLL